MRTPYEVLDNLKAKIVESVNAFGPVEVGDKKLILHDVTFDDIDKANPNDNEAQKQHRLNNKTFALGIYAKADFTEGGKTKTQKVKIGNLPVPTNMGSYIVDGGAYNIDHQFRLKPGAYLREKANGEIETHINPNGFTNAKVTIDPKTLKLTFGIGQANINSIAFLHAMKMSESDQRKLLGNEIYEANAAKLNLAKEYQKLSAHLSPFKDVTPEQAPELLAESLNRAKLDPDVTQITLGKKFTHLNRDAIAAIVKKTIDGSRGLAEFDERDALAFKTVHAVEDFVGERLSGKNKNSILWDMKNALVRGTPINSSLLDSRIKPLFNSSSISEFAARDNPLHQMGAFRKVTSTGEGGLENEHSITADAQAVHPSQAFFVDPLDSPQSTKAGIAVKFTNNIEIHNNQPYAEFRNVKTDRKEKKSPIDMWNNFLLLPGTPAPDGTVTAIHKGKQVQVKPSQITHEPYHTHDAFAETSLIAPFLGFNQANRAGMRAAHAAQATSLVHRSVPYVQSKTEFGTSYEKELGEEQGGAAVAPFNLRINKIEPGYIHVEDTKTKEKMRLTYSTYDQGTNKAYFHSEINHLKPGMEFKKGEVIFDSNFTRDGHLALGTAMHTAYMPWHGLNFEDGIVISESGAKQLTSNHMATHDFAITHGQTIMGKKQFVAAFPNKYNKKLLDKYDDNGMPLPGVILEPGDPIYLKTEKQKVSKEGAALGKLHKALIHPYKDASETWTGIHPAKVVDSVLKGTFGKVNVTYEAPAQVGDKLSNRHGSKGVISGIVKDEEMPHTKHGERIDLIQSPLSVITRMSMGQILETSASKIGKKTGKPYLVESFDKEDQVERIKKDMKTHGVSDTEELIDPKTGHSYGQVLTGYPITQKLFKLAHGNLSARELGAYDIDHKPVTGGDEGSKSVDALTLYGLMAHGNRAILNEVSTFKGDYNPEFWQRLQMGHPLPKPQVPFAYKKFEGLLAASGINIRQDGNLKILAPMTDADVHASAGLNKIENFKALDHNFNPIKGGLFDVQNTGGPQGNKWSKYDLTYAIPNPMFESAIKSITNIDDKTFNGLLNHTHHIDGKTGSEAFQHILGKIDVQKEITEHEALLHGSLAASKKDKVIKKLKLLKALNHLDLKPQDAYMMGTVPIVPPSFRPVVELPNGSAMKSNLNVLYRDMGAIAEVAKEHGMNGDLYHELYKSVGAIQGVNDPVSPQARGQKIKGAMTLITGSTPKRGFFQNKVLRKQQDVSARATIALDNNLQMDEISIPKDMAHTIYRPFATKALIQQGYSPTEAHRHIDEQTHIGNLAIKNEMQHRPVMMNRAPSLHRFSIMAFKPKINDTESVLIPGLIVKPFGADFDGDTVMLHVPVTEQARKEALGMLPSQNLYNARNMDLNFTPDQEAVMGLHILSQSEKGRAHINSMLPAGVPKIDSVIKKSHVSKILENIAKSHPKEFGAIATRLKEEGDKAATLAGYSLSIHDLKSSNSAITRKLYSEAYKLPENKRQAAFTEVDNAIKASSTFDSNNNFVKAINAQARGSQEQLKQILFSPGMLVDHNGKAIPRPLLSNYGSGMEFHDYWTSTYGARKGVLDKQMQTSKPGALNKEIVNSTIDVAVTEEDCGTHKGLKLKASDPHAMNRFDVTGHRITADYLKNKEYVVVRSPQTCESTHGVCKKCFGINEFGHVPNIGHNVGIVSAQAMSEPLTQAAMKTFHTGGTASGGGGVFGGFQSIENFLQAPETFKNRAILATKDGVVESITPGAAGGFHVEIGGKNHFITPRSGELKVKKGQHVKKGDLLNHGIPHPIDTIELLGPHEGGQVVVDSLHDLYKSSGINIDRRNLETVVRGLTGFAKIKDSGSHPTLVENDVIRLNRVLEFNRGIKSEATNPEHAHGMILTKATAGIPAGTVLDHTHIKKLKDHKTIDAQHRPIEYDRAYIGSSFAPTKTGDWMGNIAFRHLRSGLQNGAMYASQTDVHGYHPIAPFVTGELQLHNPEGKY